MFFNCPSGLCILVFDYNFFYESLLFVLKLLLILLFPDRYIVSSSTGSFYIVICLFSFSNGNFFLDYGFWSEGGAEI